MEGHFLKTNSGQSIQAPMSNLLSFIEWRCQTSLQTSSVAVEVLVLRKVTQDSQLSTYVKVREKNYYSTLSTQHFSRSY